MITLEKDHLRIRAPEINDGAQIQINLQRTLRVPDAGDDECYPLPPGLGTFPLRHIEDFSDRLPDTWVKRGGIIFPMYQAEAMWINFNERGGGNYPFAIKIGTGKINAVSGQPWSNELRSEPQDYLVAPGQPWLDGYAAAEGIVRQFVAMPLGSGLTVEHHLSGKEEHGGIQILAYPMKRERYCRLIEERERAHQYRDARFMLDCLAARMDGFAMGIAAGGRIRQEIYSDPFGLDAWDVSQTRRCFVTIVNSETWTHLTREPIPMAPATTADYAKAGLPWFDYYDENLKPLTGVSTFLNLPTLSRVRKTVRWLRGGKELPVVDVGPKERPIPRRVTEGGF